MKLLTYCVFNPTHPPTLSGDKKLAV